MATTLQYTQHFPAPLEVVWQMLTDPEYISFKGLRSGSLEVNPEVAEETDHTVIISRRTMPAKIPSFMRRFVGDVIIINETQTWRDPEAQGSRDGSFVIDFGGQPMGFHGTLALRANSGATALTTDGIFKASVPVVGRKAEAVAKEWCERYLRKEEQVGAEWLSRG